MQMGYAVLIQERQWGDPHKIVPAQSQGVEVISQTIMRQGDVDVETINSIQVVEEKGSLSAGLTRNQFNQRQSVL